MKPSKRIKNVTENLSTSISDRNVYFELYLPNKDRTGHDLPGTRTWEDWVEMGTELLASMSNGGASKDSNLQGKWLNEKENIQVEETTARIYTYTTFGNLEIHQGEVRQFLHQFGETTNQGEVAFVVNDTMYGITNCSPQQKSIFPALEQDQKETNR